MSFTKKHTFLIIAPLAILLTAGLGYAIGKQQCTQHNTPNDNIPNLYQNHAGSPMLPNTLELAGEQVPLDVYYVREALDKELIINCYQHSKTIQIIKRAARYFPVIEPILKEEGVPDDFKYLCVAESGLENVVSPAKAAGFWQFLASTAKIYGLEVSDEVDERYNLEKATHAACKYLKNAKASLGSWSLAAAAYNMGEANLKKNIENQNINNYWDLYLNQETSRYIYRILSYKLIMENPVDYGYGYCQANLYHPIPCKEITVTSPLPSLYDFAKAQGVSYKELKFLNPWLRNSKISVAGKKYTLKIPEKNKNNYFDLYRHIPNPYVVECDSVK